jgi:hypothetical protein
MWLSLAAPRSNYRRERRLSLARVPKSAEKIVAALVHSATSGHHGFQGRMMVSISSARAQIRVCFSDSDSDYLANWT